MSGYFFLGLCRAVPYTLGPRVLVPGENRHGLSWNISLASSLSHFLS